MNTSTSVSVPTTSEAELLSFLTQYAVTHHFSVALWQLPNSGTRHILLTRQHVAIGRDTALEDLDAGFVFAPFDKEKPCIFLRGDYLFTFENQQLKDTETPLQSFSAAWLREQFHNEAKNETKTKLNTGKPASTAAAPDYIQLILKSIAEIEKGTFEKVVPSRNTRVNLPAGFDVLSAFDKLAQRYPNALVSLVNIPGVGTWLGASPELLVSVEDKTIFKTVALAGTKPYQQGTNPRSVAWTQKEIEEQALVERYVISCFKKIRVREYDEYGPKTVVAGNLMHLKSDFTVDMKAINFPQLGTVMLQLLHPTSAVCGMPLESSLSFLKEHEGYDRSFYSGYLGPVNVGNNINIFVNLRCMQVFDNEAILYAGAGVTIDSVPEDEYDETEMKFNTLLNVINT